MNILVIEDEKELGESIRYFLRQEGYQCDLVFNFEKALNRLHLNSYDCVVLDIMLPDGNGLDLLQILKAEHMKTGIIIVSAKNALDDKINGLKSGADDYLAKPFHLPELSARIQSIIRRRQFEGEKKIVFHDLTLYPDEYRVLVQDNELNLTRKEFDLLLYLVGNKNRVLTREAIAEHLLGDQADLIDSFDFIYTHIKNLRKKIIQAGGNDYIKTIYAIGYKFEVK